MDRIKYYGMILLVFLMDSVCYLAVGTVLEHWFQDHFLLFFIAFVVVSVFFAPVVPGLLLLKLPLPFSGRKKHMACIAGYVLMALVLMLLVYQNWEAMLYLLAVGVISVFFHRRVYRMLSGENPAVD